MVLKDIAYYVEDSISSDNIEIEQYVTTDSLLQNKEGRSLSANLPPQPCSLTHYLPGDVLVANIRPYLKKVWKADIEGGCSKDVLVIRAKDNHYSEFIYALSLQDSFFDNAMLGNKGTQMPRGDKDKILEYPVFINNFNKEQKIGNIIDDIQRKISLNTRMNAELEAMAKQLYDYWFVQFDFPDENGNPYKSSGGKMVYNSTLKREIPEGWYASNICKIASILSGGTPSKAVDEYWKDGTIPFFGPTDYNGNIFQIQTATSITEKGLKNCASSLFEEGDIIITARGSIGKLVIVGTPMAMNQSCYVLRSFYKEIEYLYFLTIQLIDFLKAKGNGSVFKSIITSDIEDSILCIAKDDIISLFCNKMAPLFAQIKKNTEENIELTHLRDSLLPMLMNGQVTVE